jgi:hypothetical protein
MNRSQLVGVFGRPRLGHPAASGLLTLLLATPQLVGAVSAPTVGVTSAAPTSAVRATSINLPRNVTVPEAVRNAVPLQMATGVPQVIGTSLAMMGPAMQYTACFPPSPTLTTALLPTAVVQSSGAESKLPLFFWTATVAGLNYVVERALDVPNAPWALVASTCGGTPAYIGAVPTDPLVSFVDATAGLTPGATYVYKLTAVNGVNQTQWLSFRWTVPTVLTGAQFSGLGHSGSTVLFTATWDSSQTPAPSEITVSASNGFTTTLRPFMHGNGVPPACTHQAGSTMMSCPVKVPANVGPLNLTMTTQWAAVWDNARHVLAQYATNASINVQP